MMRAAALAPLAPVLALALAGCGLQPLYSGGTSGPVARTLSHVEVAPIAGKSGWLMRNAVHDRLAAMTSGAPLYRLDITLDDTIAGLGVRRDNSVTRERRTLRARFQLVDLVHGTVRPGVDGGIGCGRRCRRLRICDDRGGEHRAGGSVEHRRRPDRGARRAVCAAAPRRIVKANEGQIRAALERPGTDIRLYLLHGPDEAGADQLARTLARALGPDAERIDLDPATLKSDPARLADEAAALSLFGGRRFIRVTGAGEECVPAANALLEAPRAGNPAVLIAPAVRTSAKIVKLAQGSPAAMAHGCYVPEGANAERLASQLARAHGLRPTGRSAARLVAASGGDRAVMQREVEKLAQFLDADADRVRELDDAALDAIGADRGEAEIGRVVSSAVAGDVAMLGGELRRLGDAGVSPIPVLRALVRQLILLSDIRAEVERGSRADAAMERHRIFPRDRDAMTRALGRWDAPRLAAAVTTACRAERAVIAAGTAGEVLAEAAILRLAGRAARR